MSGTDVAYAVRCDRWAVQAYGQPPGMSIRLMSIALRDLPTSFLAVSSTGHHTSLFAYALPMRCPGLSRIALRYTNLRSSATIERSAVLTWGYSTTKEMYLRKDVPLPERSVGRDPSCSGAPQDACFAGADRDYKRLAALLPGMFLNPTSCRP
eukprot:2144961-Rhodomonas_salina.3